jgi:exodeoxyribonuclease VII large subunit
MASMPLFDPARRGGREPERLLTVTELTARIRGVLEADFDDVGVEGEISNLAQPRSGHVYFTLKDAGAQIRAVLWKNAAQKLVFSLEDGLSVRVRGALSVYAPRGEYQIVLRRIEPAGLGALDLAFRQLVAKLEAEGLFHPARKRAVPRYPTRIAIISSPTGAAVRDIVRVMGQRWPLAELLIVSSRVQGDGAHLELIAGLRTANALPGTDLIVLARGGGSLEDLWAFNHEGLARAIVASRLPVVSAVGHEVDTTIADLAADLRAPTPSAAGALCTPDCVDIRLRLDDLEQRLGRLLHLRTERAAAVLRSLDQRATHALQRLWIGLRARLAGLAQRLEHAQGRDLDRRRHRVAEQVARLESLSPLAVLARGYSITLHEVTGRVIASAAQAAPGDRIRTRLGAGALVSRVETSEL